MFAITCHSSKKIFALIIIAPNFIKNSTIIAPNNNKIISLQFENSKGIILILIDYEVFKTKNRCRFAGMEKF